MQINANTNLPVISGLQTESVSARQARARSASASPAPAHNTQADIPAREDTQQAGRRPPLFVPSTANTKLSHAGEQALRAYQGVAMAGGREELVNRINEMV